MLISQTDSLLFQSITMCRLLSELYQKNFLESDFYNAIAHSLCEYPAAGKMIFKDINPKNNKETFEIKIDSYKVEQLLELLQKLIIEFLNERYHPEK